MTTLPANGDAHSKRHLALLEIEPDLGADLPREVRARARKLTVAPAVDLPPGPVDLSSLIDVPSRRGAVFAFMVADGVLIRDVMLGGRVATQLLGPGDIVDLREAGDVGTLPSDMRLTAAQGVRIALLDDRFLAAIRRWPWMAGRLVGRVGRQVHRGAIQQAISQLSRVELRLLALMWHLADRFGTVTGKGVVIRLDLTHEALGRLAGAARPTVTLALKELAADGHLVRRADGSWLLARESMALLGEHSGEALPAVSVGTVVSATDAPLTAPGREAQEMMANLEALRERLASLQVWVGGNLARSAELLDKSRARRDGLRRARRDRP